MDDLLYATQWDPTQQQWVSKITTRSLKEIPPSFPDKAKESSGLENALAEYRDWEIVKDILG